MGYEIRLHVSFAFVDSIAKLYLKRDTCLHELVHAYGRSQREPGTRSPPSDTASMQTLMTKFAAPPGYGEGGLAFQVDMFGGVLVWHLGHLALTMLENEVIVTQSVDPDDLSDYFCLGESDLALVVEDGQSGTDDVLLPPEFLGVKVGLD